jgi:hypothetical protein
LSMPCTSMFCRPPFLSAVRINFSSVIRCTLHRQHTNINTINTPKSKWNFRFSLDNVCVLSLFLRNIYFLNVSFYNFMLHTWKQMKISFSPGKCACSEHIYVQHLLFLSVLFCQDFMLTMVWKWTFLHSYLIEILLLKLLSN